MNADKTEGALIGRLKSRYGNPLLCRAPGWGRVPNRFGEALPYSSARLGKTTGRPYQMNEDEFERDAAKAQSNLATHGVIFGAARRVRDHVFALERYDFDSEPGRPGTQ